VQGDDVSERALYYDVLDAKADSRYPEDGYDLALLRIVGVDEATPVVPIVGETATPVAVGDDVLAVGFGMTDPNDQIAQNTKRHSLAMKVVLSRPDQVSATATGNLCSGDSGGPVLWDTGNGERVAAVTSTTDPGCVLVANSTPVWPAFTDELAPFMEEDVPESCDRCTSTLTYGHGQCADISRRCDEEPQCRVARRCLSRCEGNEACQIDCVAEEGAGIDLLLERYHCFCDPCAAVCTGTTRVCAHLESVEAGRLAALAGAAADGGVADAGAADAGQEAPSRSSGDGNGCVVAGSIVRPADPRGAAGKFLLLMASALGVLLARRRR
jgi:hypothetical protein